jgi:N-glycosylase/DNA lyase
MKELLKQIEKLKKGEVKKLVEQRIAEFKKAGKSPGGKIFSELCYCILTANSTAERCIAVQKAAEKEFAKLPEQELAKRLKSLGARFHTKRAGYICEARKHGKNLQKSRDWLVKNVKGLGMKEASHFLRNIGFTDVAIIDFHIIDILVKHGLIKRTKTLIRQKYLEIEEEL